VLVPCLGFTREGYRLGYGGGYFDRWLAAHPGVTAVGLAWSVGECTFAVEPHDLPLAVVITERELLAP
jgi:5-formyltetrahydrofolate cyclo-ligase